MKLLNLRLHRVLFCGAYAIDERTLRLNRCENRRVVWLLNSRNIYIRSSLRHGDYILQLYFTVALKILIHNHDCVSLFDIFTNEDKIIYVGMRSMFQSGIENLLLNIVKVTLIPPFEVHPAL